MVGPGEITADVDAQVFVGIFCFQCLTMERIVGCYGFPSLVGHDPDDVAFARVEVHLPGVFPLFQGVKVLLK